MVYAMRIRWHGHSCFEFFDSENSVIIDPHDGKSIGIKPPISNANIVLVSHDHFDHNATRIIKNEYSLLFAEKGKHKIKGIEFEGMIAPHDDKHGGLRGMTSIYKFTMEGITVCHCGDLGAIPSEDVIKKIKNVDILFVPVGEVYTLSIAAAKEFIEMVEPRVMVPMHYRVGGITLPIKTLEDFLTGIPEDVILYVGNEVELSSDEVSEFSGLWIFDR
ncbi:MAG: MBL fold metallo-hydrolase [Methanomassiliicoccaceae archaeon]|nr:MBL fold metallo-hydrolase [Methanomassiliicoccaceae archaeon]